MSPSTWASSRPRSPRHATCSRSAKGSSWQLHFRALEVIVDADAARVEQILLILLDNAIRHTPAGGKITVGVGRDDGYGTVSVRDTGTGISQDSQQFVFDRFYQADPSREGQGLGLGLAIARGLADAHGGSIEVRSTPQVGSVFTVRLPLAQTPTPVEAAGVPGAAASRLTPERR